MKKARHDGRSSVGTVADPDDPESWLRQFKDAGLFFTVDVQIAGLGRIEAIQKLYVEHAGEVISAE